MPALGWVWQDYGRRADHLDLKEKELRAKEAELRKLEQDLRSTGALKPEKNWPPCCAFTHHDIAGEVMRWRLELHRCTASTVVTLCGV